MNPRICRIKHDPPNSYGDCIRACIATLIDCDDVPHVFDERAAEDSWAALRSWLAAKHKVLAVFSVDDHFEFMQSSNPGITYMLLCSIADGDHAVLCRDGKVVHDPAWYRTEIVGAHSCGHYLVFIVGDLV